MFMRRIKERLSFIQRRAFTLCLAAVAACFFPVMCFAEETTGGGVSGADALSSVVVTTDMLKPIVDAVVANVKVILPVGVVIFGILLGIGLIRGILKKVSGA